MKLSIIIPVYNEGKTCIDIIKRVASIPIEKEILVVDDGSSVSIGAALMAENIANLKFFQHTHNQGKGAAIRTALQHAMGEAVIIQDADNEYFPEDFPLLLQAYQENKALAVYGVRTLKKRTFIMRFGNQFVTLITNLLFGSKLKDMETCYKLIDVNIMRALDLSSRRFEIEAEITGKLLKWGIKIVQVPIRYEARREGKKLSVLDGLPTVRTLLKCYFWSAKKPIIQSSRANDKEAEKIPS